MQATWLWLAAAAMVAVALVHSILGEWRLIGPVIASRAGVMARPLARQVMRFAWHLTSALMVLSAATIVWPATAPTLIVAIGATWLVAGLIDAVGTRGRHIGWPFLTAAGAFALLGGWT